MNSSGEEIPAVLRGYPGAVVRLGADGIVTMSNGRLESRLEQHVVGASFADLVDQGSSRSKWERIFQSANSDDGGRWELILGAGARLTDPLAFSVIRDEDGNVWVVELPADPRLEQLSREVHTINSALNTSQRELSKEKRRLDQALQELQDRQAELARSNRDLEQFAHVVSHDLKAPLRNVRSYAEFLRQDLKGTLPEEAEGFLERIISRSAEMDSMINGVLRYARAGRPTGPHEVVDVGAMVQSLVELYQPDPSLRVSIAADLPHVQADPIQLRQVLQNLISNALRHGGGDEPALHVDWRDAGEFHELIVRDEGPGIPPADRERIWNLFYTTSRSGEDEAGSGIGLALVKRLVEGNGGSISLESEEEKGAAFIVKWPKRGLSNNGLSKDRSGQRDE